MPTPVALVSFSMAAGEGGSRRLTDEGSRRPDRTSSLTLVAHHLRASCKVGEVTECA